MDGHIATRALLTVPSSSSSSSLGQVNASTISSSSSGLGLEVNVNVNHRGVDVPLLGSLDEDGDGDGDEDRTRSVPRVVVPQSTALTSTSTAEVGTGASGAGWKEVRSGSIVSLNDDGSGRASENGGSIVGPSSSSISTPPPPPPPPQPPLPSSITVVSNAHSHSQTHHQPQTHAHVHTQAQAQAQAHKRTPSIPNVVPRISSPLAGSGSGSGSGVMSVESGSGSYLSSSTSGSYAQFSSAHGTYGGFSPAPGSGLTPPLSVENGGMMGGNGGRPRLVSEFSVGSAPGSRGAGGGGGELLGLGIAGMGQKITGVGVREREPSGLTPPPAMNGSMSGRGSMILYRFSSGGGGGGAEDGVLYPPGGRTRGMYSALAHTNSADSVVELGMGDSKYPMMHMPGHYGQGQGATRPGTPTPAPSTFGASSTLGSIGGMSTGTTPLLGGASATPSSIGSWGGAGGLVGVVGYAGAQSEFGLIGGLPLTGTGTGTPPLLGTMGSHRSGLVAYAYDPEEDEDADELDEEEVEWVKSVRGKFSVADSKGKGKGKAVLSSSASSTASSITPAQNEKHTLVQPPSKHTTRSFSSRGFVNITALIILISGVMSLFVVYPVTVAFKDDVVERNILGNTRINATGQAVAFGVAIDGGDGDGGSTRRSVDWEWKGLLAREFD